MAEKEQGDHSQFNCLDMTEHHTDGKSDGGKKGKEATDHKNFVSHGVGGDGGVHNVPLSFFCFCYFLFEVFCLLMIGGFEFSFGFIFLKNF